MRCPRREMQVFLHAHGQVRGIERFAVERHLESCESCRAVWAHWVAEKDAVRRALAPIHAGERRYGSFADEVRGRIRMEPQLPADSPPSAAAGTLPWLIFPAAPGQPPGRGRFGRRGLALAVLVALLAIVASAMAAFWAPSHLNLPGGTEGFECGTESMNAPPATPVPASVLPAGGHVPPAACPAAGSPVSNAPAAAHPIRSAR